MPSLDIGKTGIEKYKNESLVGLPGKREIEVNAFGREIREINVESSQQGSEINLTIDSRIQKFASNELNNHKAGSVVVMDVNSGEIIAMTSAPNYNPNLIISKPNQKYWDSIINNTLSPLTHRSVQGLYSPGSTFKMIVALAGLKKNLINLNDKALCSGKIEFGDRLYHCWKTKGHGLVNMDNAIKESCDVFFYELSKKVGIDDIAKMAFVFGLGQKFDFGFENEKKGIIPSKKWKKEK
jgi:Cell division protein FtsI/penicillin-binding protein 2